MASITTPKAIAAAFIAGQRPAYRLDSLKIVEGPKVRELQSYGPHFPVIVDYTNDSAFYLNTERNSATTNRHVQAATLALNEAGYKPTDVVIRCKGMLFAEYRLAQG